MFKRDLRCKIHNPLNYVNLLSVKFFGIPSRSGTYSDRNWVLVIIIKNAKPLDCHRLVKNEIREYKRIHKTVDGENYKYELSTFRIKENCVASFIRSTHSMQR